jgi:Excinuclease ABC subunit C
MFLEKLHNPFNSHRQVLMDIDMIEDICLVLTDEPPALYPCIRSPAPAGRIHFLAQKRTDVGGKDLKKRVSSYLQKRDHDPKTSALVQAARDLDFIITNTEVEALLLENTLINKHPPRRGDAKPRAGAFGSGMRRRIVRGPGISAAGKDEVMGRGCGELEGVQTKKGAGVWHAVVSSGLWAVDCPLGFDGATVFPPWIDIG